MTARLRLCFDSNRLRCMRDLSLFALLFEAGLGIEIQRSPRDFALGTALLAPLRGTHPQSNRLPVHGLIPGTNTR